MRETVFPIRLSTVIDLLYLLISITSVAAWDTPLHTTITSCQMSFQKAIANGIVCLWISVSADIYIYFFFCGGGGDFFTYWFPEKIPFLEDHKKGCHQTHCVKSFPVRSFYLDWMEENTNQKKLRIWTHFTQWLSHLGEMWGNTDHGVLCEKITDYG